MDQTPSPNDQGSQANAAQSRGSIGPGLPGKPASNRPDQAPPELKRRSDDPEAPLDEPIDELIEWHSVWHRMFFPLFRPLWFAAAAMVGVSACVFLVSLPIPAHGPGESEKLPVLQWLPARMELSQARHDSKRGAWDEALVHWRWLTDRLRRSEVLVADFALAARGATNSALSYAETEMVRRALLPPGSTNSERISLAFQILQGARRHGPIVRCVEAYPESRPRDYLSFYFQGLLNIGEIDRFRPHWIEHGKPEAFGGRDQIEYLAASVIFGAPDDAAQARRTLIEAANGADDRGVAANRALVALGEYSGNRDEVTAAYGTLRRLGRLTLGDHVSMVAALIRFGDENEAMLLAKTFVQKQASPDEVDQASQILERLSLRRDAISMVNQGLEGAESSELLSLRLFELLMAQQDWSGLRDLSRRLNTQRRNSEFLNALALFGEELMPTEDPPLSLAGVESIGTELSNAGPGSPTVRFLSCLERHHLGMVAAQIAGACEKVFAETASYWELRQRIAIAAKNTFELQYAAKRTLEIDPSSPVARADLGFALLVQRRDAATVLKDSEEALADFPTNSALRVNLGGALAQVRRWQDSLEALNLAQRETLTVERKGLANLASVEALVGLGRKQEARTLVREIDRNTLFPEQIRWLDQLVVDGTVAAAAP